MLFVYVHMSDVIHAALHARHLTRRTRGLWYGATWLFPGRSHLLLVPPVPNITPILIKVLLGLQCLVTDKGEGVRSVMVASRLCGTNPSMIDLAREEHEKEHGGGMS